MKEISNSDEKSNLPDKPKFDIDTFKSIYYWANAKPDTQIKFFRERKKIELSDIYDLNQRVNQKLQTHNIETYIVSLNFILRGGNVKEYSSWAEFQRENWNTINQRIECINLTWDLTFSIPNFAIPQRHTLKVRIGNAIPPKDMFQIMFTSDEPSELMESQAEGLVKVDFINQVLATELIQRVANWQEGLNDVYKRESSIRFIENKEKYIRSFIEYLIPIIFVYLSYLYYNLFLNYFNYSMELDLLSVQRVAIVFLVFFSLGKIFSNYLSNWLGRKIEKFKTDNGINISKGDSLYLEELKNDNDSVLSQIRRRLFISLIVTIILITIKFIYTLIMSNI